MKMKRVEIEIESPRRYTEVAHFVDQKGFCDDIEKTREWLKIVPGEYLVSEYRIVELDRLVVSYREGVLTISELCIGIRDYCRDSSLLLPKIDRTLSLVLENADMLAMKYHKNRLYVQVAVAAIMTNVVTDNDYKTTQIISMDKSELRQLADELDSSYSNYFGGGDEKLLAIRIDPETTKDDLVDTFKNMKKYGYVSSNKHDTLSKIHRDRDWYWKNLYGKKPNQIANDGDSTVTYEDVTKAIARYRKFLEA